MRLSRKGEQEFKIVQSGKALRRPAKIKRHVGRAEQGHDTKSPLPNRSF